MQLQMYFLVLDPEVLLVPVVVLVAVFVAILVLVLGLGSFLQGRAVVGTILLPRVVLGLQDRYSMGQRNDLLDVSVRDAVLADVVGNPDLGVGTDELLEIDSLEGVLRREFLAENSLELPAALGFLMQR